MIAASRSRVTGFSLRCITSSNPLPADNVGTRHTAYMDSCAGELKNHTPFRLVRGTPGGRTDLSTPDEENCLATIMASHRSPRNPPDLEVKADRGGCGIKYRNTFL